MKLFHRCDYIGCKEIAFIYSCDFIHLSQSNKTKNIITPLKLLEKMAVFRRAVLFQYALYVL